MAKKDMPIYVSQLKDAELKTLIATYDIPLNLRPRLPDSNFRMINLPAGDTTIGIYSRIFDSSGVRIPFSSFLLAVLKYFKVHISQLVPLGLTKVITFEVLCRSLGIEPTVTLFRVFQTLSKPGDWFSFAKRGGSAPVCMEVTKSGLNKWKEKIFLIDRRAIPFHMPWRHPDSCITDKVPTSFNQDHVDRLKAHIVKLRDIPEGVLVRSGLSRVWHNTMCDLVLRRSDNRRDSLFFTAGDVLERDLLSFVLGPYYLPYPYDENDGCESPPYTKDDWDEIHGVNLGLRKKELYKDPKCQLITHGRAFHARYDHSLREVERLAKRCAHQTQIIKKQSADLKQHKESTVHASEEVSGWLHE
ncbi:hypothetical protein Tco_0734573 [Tanacetum coccineum]